MVKGQPRQRRKLAKNVKRQTDRDSDRQTEREREREERETQRENSNSKALVYKDCSLGSAKNLSNS